ncbi:MAG: polymorphic toxin-type HINT domain-containing protein [Pirellulaceae bacterium]
MTFCATTARSALATGLAAITALALTTVEVRAETAKELVEEALHREIYGDRGERDALLRRAARLEPGNAAAMWHRGYVQTADGWTPAIAPLADAPQLAQYAQMREQAEDNVGGQLQLANWCRDQGLRDQQRAHLLRVVQHDPQHVEAHQRLGFRPVGGDWVAREEIEAAAEQRRTQAASLERWKEQCEQWAEFLTHPSGRRRNLAARQLSELDDRDAVYPIERVLGTKSETTAQAAIEVLARFQGQESTSALIRLAVLSPWSSVRRAAVVQLRHRDRDDYIPQMLAAMHTPITARTVAYQSARGEMVVRSALEREGRDEREQLVLDSRQTAGIRREDVARENLRSQNLNERIAAALNLATDQSLPDSPEVWWTWWNDENEVYAAGPKAVHSIRPGEQLARLDIQQQIEARLRAQEMAARIAEMSQNPRPRRHDCLAAGTVVWTSVGAIAVEEIAIGDMVLSQDVETGELTYKVVLQTTVRPASTLVKIQVGDETIETSGGHPFWVAGEGWVKARDLKSGMELHTATGPARVGLVEQGAHAVSYNLVVDGLNTYFAGSRQILTHDNTVRRPTDAIVPGLRVE